MNKWLMAGVAAFTLAGVAQAQTSTAEVTMSTDPAKAAAVEQHAAQLKQRQSVSHTSHKKASHPHPTANAGHHATPDKAAAKP